MPRNWGRLVGPNLSNSKKLAECSERAALIYGAFTLPKHDGEGRLEVDDVSMLEMCGRYGIAHRYTLEDMEAVREELRKAGLWRIYETQSGKLCAEVVGWEKNQRLDRISRESDLLDEIRNPSGGDGGDNGSHLGGITDPISGGSRGDNSSHPGGISGGSRGDLGAIQEKIREEKGRESARAREEQGSIRNSGARAETAALLEPLILLEFQSVHPMGARYVPRLLYPADYDRKAIQAAAHALQEMHPDERTEFFRRALSFLPSRRKTIEGALALLNDPEIAAPAKTRARCTEDQRSAIVDIQEHAERVEREETPEKRAEIDALIKDCMRKLKRPRSGSPLPDPRDPLPKDFVAPGLTPEEEARKQMLLDQAKKLGSG